MRVDFEHLNQVLQLSQMLHAAATESDWERVVSLEAERRPLIEIAFKVDRPVANSDAKQLISQILELDGRVIQLAGKARSSAADELSSFNRGRRVVQAYRSVAS